MKHRQMAHDLKPIVSNTKAGWLQVTSLLTHTCRSEASQAWPGTLMMRAMSQ